MPFYNNKSSGKSLRMLNEGVTITSGADSLDWVGAGVSASAVGADVTATIAGGAGAAYAYDEVPTGAIDGNNTTYTLANTPSPAGSLILQLNQGFPIHGAGNDYTLSGSTITMSVAPPTGSVLVAKQYTY
jgi:hypothetical protein